MSTYVVIEQVGPLIMKVAIRNGRRAAEEAVDECLAHKYADNVRREVHMVPCSRGEWAEL